MTNPIKLALKLFNNINTNSVDGKDRRTGRENWEPLYQINSKCLGQRELEKKCLKYFIGYLIGKITWSPITALELNDFSSQNHEGLFVRAKFNKSEPTGEVFVDFNPETLYSFAKLVFQKTSLFKPKGEKISQCLKKLTWDENSSFIQAVVWALFQKSDMDTIKQTRGTTYCGKRVLSIAHYHEQESKLQLDRKQKKAKQNLRLTKACVLIQSIWRGKNARRLFNRLAAEEAVTKAAEKAETNRQNADWDDLGDEDLLIP